MRSIGKGETSCLLLMSPGAQELAGNQPPKQSPTWRDERRIRVAMPLALAVNQAGVGHDRHAPTGVREQQLLRGRGE